MTASGWVYMQKQFFRLQDCLCQNRPDLLTVNRCTEQEIIYSLPANGFYLSENLTRAVFA